MLQDKILYSLEDITIVPCINTDIKSRSECSTDVDSLVGDCWISHLPLVTAPMDFITVDNYKIFDEAGICPIIPRTVDYNTRLKLCSNVICAFGLDELERILNNEDICDVNILIDIANGHMDRVFKLARLFRREFGKRCVIGGGNIGNPQTYLLYERAGFDFVRCAIGTGNGCLTSTQTGVGYPMASLIADTYELKKSTGAKCKIVADGGMNSYSDIIKALALGADYVMCGKLFTQAAIGDQKIGDPVLYRGMSTKSAQKDMGGSGNKTSEGKVLNLKKQYKLEGWIDNFKSYLKSAMSYSNARNLTEFKERAVCQVISNSASAKANDK